MTSVDTKLYGSDVDNAGDVDRQIRSQEESLKADLARKLKTLEDTLQVIAAGRRTAEERGFGTTEVIWNVAGYVNSCSFDLAVAGETLMFERDQWKRRFAARLAAVILYEASKDLPALLGKRFRDAVGQLASGLELLEEIGKISRMVSRFFDRNSSRLKDIRITCAAHRDDALEEQLRIVYTIQPVAVLTLVSEFDALLNQLGQLLQATIDAMNEHLEQQETV